MDASGADFLLVRILESRAGVVIGHDERCVIERTARLGWNSKSHLQQQTRELIKRLLLENEVFIIRWWIRYHSRQEGEREFTRGWHARVFFRVLSIGCSIRFQNCVIERSDRLFIYDT